MSTTQRFYDDLADDYHLIFRDWEKAVEDQGRVLDTVIRRRRPAARTLLDCACGIGTQSFGLAAQGWQVTGCDLSPGAVGRARVLAAERAVDLAFHVADMRDLRATIEGRFDVVLAADNAVPHLLSEQDLIAALGEIHGVLVDDGLFVASIRDYDKLRRERPTVMAPQFSEAGAFTHQVWQWLSESHYRIHFYVTRPTNGDFVVRHHTAHYWALQRAEMENALTRAGFTETEWLEPDQSGYYQPMVLAQAGAGRD